MQESLGCFNYLERSDGVEAGKDPVLLSSHHGLMGGCTQIYCFLLAPPAAHTFPACAHKCAQLLSATPQLTNQSARQNMEMWPHPNCAVIWNVRVHYF